MGLFVSTTGSDVVLSDLGIKITHPSTDLEISAQFTPEEIKNSAALTLAITSGLLSWKKTAGGSAQISSDYDPDFVDLEKENTGTGKAADRGIFQKQIKSGKISSGSFSGNPKKASVTFSEAFEDVGYSISINGIDSRAWSFESASVSGFTVNSNANQALTGDVHWTAIDNMGGS